MSDKIESRQLELIVQSNQLVEARYSLSLMQQRILLAMMASIRKDDDDFQDIEINLRDFAKSLGVTGKRFYAEAKEATMGLFKKPLVIQEPGGELQVSWISSARYLDGKGIVRLRFDSNLKPHLLNLKREFTILQSAAIRMNSQYSIRIYMLLKQYQRIGTRRITVVDLRHKLGIEDHQYKSYFAFKRRTLLVAQKEFEESGFSDILFDFDEEKKPGTKQIAAIVFTIRTREVKPAPEYLGELPLISALKRYGVSGHQSRKLLDEHGIEAIEQAISLYEKRLNEGVVKNKDGRYLLALIREGAGCQVPLVVEEAQAREVAEAAQKRRIEGEKREAEACDQAVAEAHRENLSWFEQLDEAAQEAFLMSLATRVTTAGQRKTVRDKGIAATVVPYIRATFDRLAAEYRESEQLSAVAG